MALQVMFICNHCPFVKHLKKDIVKLTKFYMEVVKSITLEEIFFLLQEQVGLAQVKSVIRIFYPFSTERTCRHCHIFKFRSHTPPGSSNFISWNKAAFKVLNDLCKLELCLTGWSRIHGRRC